MWRRRKRPPAAGLDTNELRSVAGRMTGWKWTGEGQIDPPRLLYEAASEIDRLRAQIEEPTA